MTPRRYLPELAALAAITLALGQAQAAAPAASQPHDNQPTQIEILTELVRQMAAAENLTALSDYASRAQAIDRNNPAVHQAHMKRALQLGRPMVAMAAALELTRLRDDWPAAWSVIGYCQGRREKMLLALVAMSKAMDPLGDDPGILNNAAICLAWYEDQQPPPRISPLLKSSLEKNKPAWMAKPAFSKAYAAAAGALASRRARMADLERQAENAQSAYYQAKNAIAIVIEEHNRTVREIANQRSALEQIEKSAAAASRPADKPAPPTAAKQPTPPPAGKANRDKIAELETLNQQRVKQVGDLTAEARAQRQKATQLRQRLYKVEHSLPTLPWMPPIVDGKASVDRDMPSTAPAAGQEHQPDSADDPASAETSPEVKVKLAEMLLRNGLPGKAAATLNEVIASHPGSPAAQRARELMAQHKLR
ncbi:MAG: hypothetical protein ABFD92_01425 [Planctomycetaceae bacterium]|nr:hypothetical protein [Planctomycetaceae bacterium]